LTGRRDDAALALLMVERRAELRALLGETAYLAMVDEARPTIADRFSQGDCVNHLQAALRIAEDVAVDPPPGITHADLAVCINVFLVTGAFHMREAEQ
jgi:hypothetical protein